ncbi:MAG: FAD-dependent oxidoreductase [Gammaproteobacteria bacterium]|jgi:3-phenylpropionate/trans-cinnamate dioxygenase ferredoxin reductase component|nr:FAD-dependent oxidoreductase [Gammaproteobacteria bacterium]
MTQTCVIVGASHAAAQLAPILRQEGWEGRIVVVGDEPYIPYHRPPLSKTFLSGEKTLEDIYIRPQMVYDKAEIEFLLNTRVEAIDREKRILSLNNGETLAYDKLALTVGSRVRKVDLPGIDLEGIYYLRDANDVEQIKSKVKEGKHAVIVGGGYIGLETAAALRKQGMDVTVLEMMERVLQRVTAPEISEFYDRVHKEEGVKICCGVGVASFAGNTNVEKVICSNGDEYAADLVVVGVGIVPNVELADAAGLEVNNGIVVDQFARTSDHDIVAAGDCTNHHNVLYDINIRLESVQNATDQARVAAQTLCGKEKAYDALPWFWSDQYDLKLQIAGLSQGYDEVIVRGDRDNSRSFAAFYLRGGVVIAVDAVNKAPEFMVGKRLITGKVAVDKMQLADENIPIKELLT